MTSDDARPHPQTAENDLIQALREGPRTYEELPYPPKPRHRKYVAKLSASASGKSRGDATTVYYLYGDERRAIRRFIDENEPFVASCMDDDSNPLANRFPEEVWRVFQEEWVWRQGAE